MNQIITWDEIDFTWILEGKLANSGYPFNKHLPFLWNKGIRAIISIERRPDKSKHKLISQGFDYLEVTWKDFTAPTLSQLDTINQFIDEKIAENKPVLVHCFQGMRSGTAIISYLVYSGVFGTCEEAYRYVRETKGVRTAANINEQKAILREYTEAARPSNVR
jgi:protein-tyrosine phosphatase